MKFTDITPGRYFKADDYFCDVEGRPNKNFNSNQWWVSFAGDIKTTTVTVALGFASEADKKKIIEMGFKEGFTMAMDKLNEILQHA